MTSQKKRALLSVFHKDGIEELGRGLVGLGYEVLSTGGTAQSLSANGIKVTSVSDLTGFPEILGGRVKTLHPKVFAGILAKRNQDHLAELEAAGIDPIDVVVVNLYPFAETVARGAAFEETVEQIDIGGPSLLRAAAKNHPHVFVVCDAADYGRVAAALATPDDANARAFTANPYVTKALFGRLHTWSARKSFETSSATSRARPASAPATW